MTLMASASLAWSQGPAEQAWDTTKDTAKAVGRATKETAKDVGQTLKRGTEKVANKIEETLAPDADARRVDVKLTGDRIDMDETVPAGKTAFVVTNTSNEKLTFALQSAQLDEPFVSTLEPQQTKSYTVHLERGSYKVGCVVRGKEKHRMNVNLKAR